MRAVSGLTGARLAGGALATRHGNPGTNNVAFSGRLGRAPLQPGSYLATFMARAGNVSSLRSNLRFRIVPWPARGDAYSKQHRRAGHVAQ